MTNRHPRTPYVHNQRPTLPPGLRVRIKKTEISIGKARVSVPGYDAEVMEDVGHLLWVWNLKKGQKKPVRPEQITIQPKQHKIGLEASRSLAKAWRQLCI